jgi:hypothetical protein
MAEEIAEAAGRNAVVAASTPALGDAGGEGWAAATGVRKAEPHIEAVRALP